MWTLISLAETLLEAGLIGECLVSHVPIGLDRALSQQVSFYNGVTTCCKDQGAASRSREAADLNLGPSETVLKQSILRRPVFHQHVFL